MLRWALFRVPPSSGSYSREALGALPLAGVAQMLWAQTPAAPGGEPHSN
jgi:hypothetical protein